MASPGRRQSREVYVSHSYYLVFDDGGAGSGEPFPDQTVPGRFVYPGRESVGGAAVFTGTFSGPVEVQLEVLDEQPVPEPDGAWDEREELELRALGERVVVFESLGDYRGFDHLEVDPGQTYHLRVHARGRQAGRGYVTGPTPRSSTTSCSSTRSPAAASGGGCPGPATAGSRSISAVTSIEVVDATAAVLREQADRAGLTVDAYIRRLALLDSLAQHGAVLDEQYYADADADAERLAG